MLKNAKMYQLSGGGDRLHKCRDCVWCVKKNTKDRFKTCARHPEHPDYWNEDAMACKWWLDEMPKEKTDTDSIPRQMSIFDMEGVTP